MTVITKGKIQIALGVPSSQVGYTAKKFAELIGRSSMVNHMTNYKQKAWFKEGVPVE
jgi:hypothetical protein